jgi:SRSO17 transposase
LALQLLTQALAEGLLQSCWVAGDDLYGQSPSFRQGVEALGLGYVLDLPPSAPAWPEAVTWEQPPYRGYGRPPVAQPTAGQRKSLEERAQALPDQAWQRLTLAEGAQGPRTYLFAVERGRLSEAKGPGSGAWLVYRRNLDGSEARYYVSNAPEETAWQVLAKVAASRWPIETEFRCNKGLVGLDEYEVRSWSGWHHHITMSLLASAFLLCLQQDWGGKRGPHHPAPGLPDRLRDLTAQALDPRATAGVVAGNPGAQ